MAILRSEIQPNLAIEDFRSTYDCIVETVADLSEENTGHMAVGSMAYVIENGSTYIKTATGWVSLTS